MGCGKQAQICFSFQKALVDSLARNLLLAAEQTGIAPWAWRAAWHATVNAGRNERALRQPGIFPPAGLCTDNAAMIARAGYERFRRKMTRFPHMSPSMGLSTKALDEGPYR